MSKKIQEFDGMPYYIEPLTPAAKKATPPYIKKRAYEDENSARRVIRSLCDVTFDLTPSDFDIRR